ncbi:MAG: hypothetical protein NY202_02770 [Mollicutes bacterium UO1]
MKNLKIYEKFPEVIVLKETIKSHEQRIIELQSEERIENSLTVKRLREEKKEIESKYSKTIENLQNQIVAKQEQIQNLMLRQKGQGKGQDFEK